MTPQTGSRWDARASLSDIADDTAVRRRATPREIVDVAQIDG